MWFIIGIKKYIRKNSRRPSIFVEREILSTKKAESEIKRYLKFELYKFNDILKFIK